MNESIYNRAISLYNKNAWNAFGKTKAFWHLLSVKVNVVNKPIKYNYSMGEVVILPPKKRLIRFTDCLTELAFPYIVFWTFDHEECYGFIHAAFSNEVVTQHDLIDGKCELWHPPFNWINSDGFTCVGSHKSPTYIDDGVHDFFNNKTVVTGSETLISNTSLRTFKRWEQLTHENDLSFITQVNWNNPLAKPFSVYMYMDFGGIPLPSDFPTYYLKK